MKDFDTNSNEQRTYKFICTSVYNNELISMCSTMTRQQTYAEALGAGFIPEMAVDKTKLFTPSELLLYKHVSNTGIDQPEPEYTPLHNSTCQYILICTYYVISACTYILVYASTQRHFNGTGLDGLQSS
jgi:hypothetical protein